MTMFPKVAKEPIQRIIDGCLAHFQPFRNFISRQTFLKPKTKDQVAIAFPARGLPHDGLHGHRQDDNLIRINRLLRGREWSGTEAVTVSFIIHRHHTARDLVGAAGTVAKAQPVIGLPAGSISACFIAGVVDELIPGFLLSRIQENTFATNYDIAGLLVLIFHFAGNPPFRNRE